MPKKDEKSQSLSEKCRIALEKRYGFEIPLPNYISKTTRGNRR